MVQDYKDTNAPKPEGYQLNVTVEESVGHGFDALAEKESQRSDKYSAHDELKGEICEARCQNEASLPRVQPLFFTPNSLAGLLKSQSLLLSMFSLFSLCEY